MVLLALLVALLVGQSCTAFVIRHTNRTGETRTYVSDTVFVGTGTVVDCIIGPLYWTAGLFYFQPYIHTPGGTLSYPSFFGAGCMGRGYNKGTGVWGTLTLNLSLFQRGTAANQVYFVDINKKEVGLMGGTIEVIRVTDRIGFTAR